MAVSQDTFSPAETYALKAQGYSNLWDTPMATVYWDLANQLWQYSGYAKTAVWAYDNLLKYIAWNESKLQNVAWGLYNELINDINNQRTYVYDMFWPEWTLTKEVDKYYDDLWNYLATDAWRQAAIIAAQWQHSWASLWAIRAQQNEAYNQSFQRYVQAKEQQINAKQQIASNLINFMSTLRQEYWNSTNQYIIEVYKRAYDLYNTVASSLGSDMMSLNQLRAASWSWSSSSTDAMLKALANLWLIKDTDLWDNSGWVVWSDVNSKWNSNTNNTNNNTNNTNKGNSNLWQNLDSANNLNISALFMPGVVNAINDLKKWNIWAAIIDYTIPPVGKISSFLRWNK